MEHIAAKSEQKSMFCESNSACLHEPTCGAFLDAIVCNESGHYRNAFSRVPVPLQGGFQPAILLTGCFHAANEPLLFSTKDIQGAFIHSTPRKLEQEMLQKHSDLLKGNSMQQVKPSRFYNRIKEVRWRGGSKGCRMWKQTTCSAASLWRWRPASSSAASCFLGWRSAAHSRPSCKKLYTFLLILLFLARRLVTRQPNAQKNICRPSKPAQ